MAMKLKENGSMFRDEFAARLSEKLASDKKTAEKLTNAFLDVLQETWSEGRAVCFRNFGIFEVRVMTERMGRNPKTMEEYPISASYKPAFRPAKALREKVSRSIEKNAGKDATS